MSPSPSQYELFGGSLVRYFLRNLPSARELLCLTDCEPLGMSEMLALCPELEEALRCDRLEYLNRDWRETLGAQLARTYTQVTSAQIRLRGGAGEALLHLMQGLLRPGDQVITHVPAFPPLYTVPESLGCEVIRWSADPAAGWGLDLDFLADKIGPRTRAVIVNFPHNPTGYVPDRGAYRALVEIVRRHDVALIGDEVYHPLDGEGPRPPLPPVADVYERGISVGSLSKAYGLSGVRVGWIATRDETILSLPPLAETGEHAGCNMLSHIMASSAVAYRHRILDRNRAILQHNRELFAGFLATHADRVAGELPAAGPVAFPSLRSDESAERLCERLLKETGVLLVPSTALDFGDRHFRIGLGRVSFPAGLERLSRFLRAS